MTKRRGTGDAMRDGGTVDRADACVLEVVDDPWPFAVEKRQAIDEHWQRRSRECPGFFNGVVHVLSRHALEGGQFFGVLRPVAFKSFLYWRESGYPEVGVRDAFGSALLRSCEGHVLLGRQGDGHLNSGLAYLPGGFIDPRDVGADGKIDIEANVRREVEEETGLRPEDLERAPGFVITRAGPHVSIAVELRSALPAEALRAKIVAHLARDPEAELSGIEIVRRGDEVAPGEMPVFTAVLLRHLFG